MRKVCAITAIICSVEKLLVMQQHASTKNDQITARASASIATLMVTIATKSITSKEKEEVENRIRINADLSALELNDLIDNF